MTERPVDLIEGSGQQGEPRDFVPRLSPAEQWRFALREIPVFQLLKNLRNLDKAGLTDDDVHPAMLRLQNPEVIARSRILPFRFLTAYLNVPSIRWGPALEKALELALPNVPVLPGRTLILIDTSDSMNGVLSVRPERHVKKGEPPVRRPTRMYAAALFAFALAIKNAGRVDVFGFANGQFRCDGIGEGASLLRSLELFCAQRGKVGHGTQIALAMRSCWNGEDRVVIFTDEQETFGGTSQLFYGSYASYRGHGDVNGAVPASVPVYCWNLAGYEFGAMPVAGNNRHVLAGLTDSSFSLMQQIEAGLQAKWPWETREAA